MLTLERLREVLLYDTVSGEFAWRIPRPKIQVGTAAGGFCNGYRIIKIDGRSYKAHRLAWLYVYGKWPLGRLDHADHNRANNRINNLRDCNARFNSQNRKSANSDNTTGLLGVSPNGNNFKARIRIEGESTYLGTFATAKLAHEAYLAAKREHHPGCTI